MLSDLIREGFERYCVLADRAEAVPRLRAAGTIAGQKVETTVDSAAARYYVEGVKRSGDVGVDYHRIAALRECAGISAEAMQAVAIEFSPDVAALLLADRLSAMERNREFNSVLQEWLDRLKTLSAAGRKPPSLAERHLMLFVPGWHYRSIPETGADFSKPRRILAELGIDHDLIETDENGIIEANASLIAEQIRKYSQKWSDIILVSASKSGAEVAHAIGELLPPEETRSVKAWINIGGLLHGTHLADSNMRWPQGWLVRVLFAVNGWRTGSIESMKPARSRARFARLRIPRNILVVNYIGIPLSGNVTARARHNYRRLRRYGANDGLSLLTDELVTDAISVVELGVDHYYLDPEMDIKAAAIGYSVIAWLDSHAG